MRSIEISISSAVDGKELPRNAETELDLWLGEDSSRRNGLLNSSILSISLELPRTEEQIYRELHSIL